MPDVCDATTDASDVSEDRAPREFETDSIATVPVPPKASSSRKGGHASNSRWPDTQDILEALLQALPATGQRLGTDDIYKLLAERFGIPHDPVCHAWWEQIRKAYDAGTNEGLFVDVPRGTGAWEITDKGMRLARKLSAK